MPFENVIVIFLPEIPPFSPFNFTSKFSAFVIEEPVKMSNVGVSLGAIGFPKLMNVMKRTNNAIITTSKMIIILLWDESFFTGAISLNLLPHLLQNISSSSVISAPHWSQYRAIMLKYIVFTI